MENNIFIVDLPIASGDFNSYISLPEGINIMIYLTIYPFFNFPLYKSDYLDYIYIYIHTLWLFNIAMENPHF